MPSQHAFVSLIDVLGYRNKIAQDRSEGTEVFKEKLQSSLSALSTINETEMSYQAISDTIIFSALGTTSFPDFLRMNGAIQKSFLENGLFIRGGIAYAPHFRSGSVTYSHALPVAHEIEQKQAIYPRIVLDKNLIEMMQPGQLLESVSDEISRGELIFEQNGVYFLNPALNSLNETYSSAKEIYQSEEEALRGKEHELSKHRWLHDFLLSRAGDKFTPYISGCKPFDARTQKDGAN